MKMKDARKVPAGQYSGGTLMSRRRTFGAAVALAMILALAVGSAVPDAQQTTRELFPNTEDRGRAAVEYEDDDLHVVAAYYYSQRHHDSRWLLIEIGVTSSPVMRIDRDDIYLLTPDDRRIELATQRSWSQDHQRVRPIIQSARTTRHGIGGYFTERGSRNFQFFVLPFDGISRDFFDADRFKIGWGDLFFASPTGSWSEGTYSLVVEVEEKDARAVLPIDLD